jgi:hypothetical protein
MTCQKIIKEVGMKKLGILLAALVTVTLVLSAIGCSGGGGGGATATPTHTVAATATPTHTVQPGVSPTPTTPVPFEAMIPFLPQPPSGWTAEDATGSTYSYEDYAWSNAARNYTNQTTDENVSVSIDDSAYYYGFGWWEAYKNAYSYQTTEGYGRTTTVAGYPAYQMYTKSMGTYYLDVIVGDRFMVSITTENESTLSTFSNLINYGGIAALK